MIVVNDVLVRAVKENLAKAAPALPAKLGLLTISEELVNEQAAKFKVQATRTMLEVSAVYSQIFPNDEQDLDAKPLAQRNLWYWLYGVMGGDQPRANASHITTFPKMKIS